jgi:hypothetical protein
VEEDIPETEFIMTDPYVPQHAPSSPTTSGSTTDTLKGEGRRVADDAAQGTKHVAGVAANEAASVADEAKHQARSLWSQTSSQLSSQAADQKDTLVSWLRDLADELSSMADSSRRGTNGSQAASSGQAGVASGLAQRGADYAHRTASWLSDREPSAVFDEVGSFARRRPGAFLALAAAAGIVVGRLTRGLTAGQDDDDYPRQRRMVTPDVPVGSVGYTADVTPASSWAAPTAQPEDLTGADMDVPVSRAPASSSVLPTAGGATPEYRSQTGQQGAYPEDGR